MDPINRNVIAKALVGLALLSLGASRCPGGGPGGLLLSIVGCAVCLVFVLSLGGFRGTKVQRILRAGLAVIGVLVLWAGTIAAATAVAGVFHARNHNMPYTGSAEVVMAVICAVIAPALLTFKGRAWMGWNRGTLVLLWGYWLVFYPLTIIATALAWPWGAAR
jgi:hypothetical protein